MVASKATSLATPDRDWPGKLQSSSWLFPGRQAGRYQDPDYVGRRLKKIGIQCNRGRNAALIQLGSEVSALVMTELLNLRPQRRLQVDRDLRWQLDPLRGRPRPIVRPQREATR